MKNGPQTFLSFKNSLPELTEHIVCQNSSAKPTRTNLTKTDQDQPKPTQTNQNQPVGASLEFVVEEEVVLVI